MIRNQLLRGVGPLFQKSQLALQQHLAKKCRYTQFHQTQYNMFYSIQYGFFNIFSSKPKLTFTDKYKNSINQVLEQVKIEEDLIEKENLMFQAFQLFNDAKIQEIEDEEEICIHIQDIFENLEDIMDNYSSWNEESLFQMKFLLLQGFYEYKNEIKVERYVEEFSSDYFIERVFDQFQNDLQIIFTVYFSQMLIQMKKPQTAIRVCEKFINEFLNEEEILCPVHQQICVILIQVYKSQKMHTNAFELIEKAIKIINKVEYQNQMLLLAENEKQTLLNEIAYLIEYCYEYQQYENAYNLGEGLLNCIDLNQQQTYDNLSFEITLMKNLNKHYKILLSLNAQISKLNSQIDKYMEDTFIKSYEKFLNYQDQINQVKNMKNKFIYAKPLIETNLHKFSSESKHQILKIAHKFDQLSN